mmetsp:Transcript_75653/g.221788  ORF Transcript_75653/g.221788 Transcript_75653/m.221788 type:complete len:214 (+) Transcript_75653:266-907(+)
MTRPPSAAARPPLPSRAGLRSSRRRPRGAPGLRRSRQPPQASSQRSAAAGTSAPSCPATLACRPTGTCGTAATRRPWSSPPWERTTTRGRRRCWRWLVPRTLLQRRCRTWAGQASACRCSGSRPTPMTALVPGSHGWLRVRGAARSAPPSSTLLPASSVSLRWLSPAGCMCAPAGKAQAQLKELPEKSRRPQSKATEGGSPCSAFRATDNWSS